MQNILLNSLFCDADRPNQMTLDLLKYPDLAVGMINPEKRLALPLVGVIITSA